MRERLGFNTVGNADYLLSQIIANASEETYLNPYDLLMFKQQSIDLPGVEIVDNTAIIELGVGHPQGFGNYFITKLFADSSVPQSRPKFKGKYPDEEFLGYDLVDESGYLLTEEGEMIVL